ncbi:hypothetical protein JAAARDRAFT_135733, partial [Jaapia argillacea MUCL 33604]
PMASEIFRTGLAVLKLGHAVWDPHPNGLYKRVEIGHVGYFDDGAFTPLFNVLKEAKDSSHSRWGVPHDFERLVLPGDPLRVKSPLPPGAYHSESVQELSASASAHAELTFSCTKEKGAVLVLPDSAHREDAFYPKMFKDHMLKHYRSWYEFAVHQCGCEIKVSDLVLVTGCHMTTKWAMAAFSNSDVRASGSFGAGIPGGVSAKFSLSGGWSTSRFVHHHSGPQPSFLGTKAQGSSNPDGSEEDDRNQCVFLRGYRVMERRFLGPKVIEAAADPQNLGHEGPEQGDTAVPCEGGETEDEIMPLSEIPKVSEFHCYRL